MYYFFKSSDESPNIRPKLITVANGAEFAVLALAPSKILMARNALYIHVHRESRRCYVGITDMRCHDRWNWGGGYSATRKFGPAIAKYGWNTFDSYILAILGSREALNRAEIAAIKAAGGHKSPHTFNLSPGGDLIAENDKPLVGVNLRTGKQRKFKSGVAAADFIGCDRNGPSEIARSRGGKKLSIRGWWFRFEDDQLSLRPREFGESARLAQVRKLQGRPVIAICYKTGESRSFATIAETARALGVNTAAVAIVVAGTGQSARGWWFRYADDPEAKPPPLHGVAARADKRSKPIYAVNLSSGERREYQSASAAARALGLGEGDVSTVALEKRKSAKGWWFTYDPTANSPSLFGRSALVREARSEPIIATILSTNERQEYPSAKLAAEALGVSRAAISKALRKNGVTKGVYYQRLAV